MVEWGKKLNEKDKEKEREINNQKSEWSRKYLMSRRVQDKTNEWENEW